MGSDDQDEAFNTGLSLDLLGFTTTTNSNKKDQQNHSFSCLKFDHVLPSLSLGLVNQAGLSTSPVGSNSCYSNNNKSPNFIKGSLVYGDEVEVEKLCSRASDEDQEEEEASPRKKLRLTKQQSAVLEDNFNQHSTLTHNQKEALAKQLNLRPRQVEVWFQNRRARTKVKQTEMECEMMKKCWEKLTEENKMLKKELTELKSLKVGSAVYVSMPAATLSMCPSCERFISDGGDGGGGGGRLFSPA